MEPLTDILDALTGALGEAVCPGDVARLADDDLLAVTSVVEALGRRVDALRVHCAGELAERSRRELGADRLSAKRGCRTPSELIARLTRVAEATASRRIRLGTLVRVRTSLIGDVLPPVFSAVAAGLACGELGTDAANAIIAALGPIRHRAEAVDWESGQRQLVADATGIAVEHLRRAAADAHFDFRAVPAADRSMCFTADQTRVEATAWQVALDPDGVEPRSEEAMRHRCLTRLGADGGLIWYRLGLVPEGSGQLERLLAAHVSPKSAPVFLPDRAPSDVEVADDRSSEQKRHDAFVSIIDAAARSAQAPTIGGAAPTVLISVDAHDLSEGSGGGHIDDVEEPISMAAITQFACAGSIQKIAFDPAGRIMSLGSPERIFTPHQRRAIGLRDGGCVIPGCTIPAGWCEIHHVEEHSRGGPTHTDNGVCLCWFHHRTINTSGWHVAMRHGVPYLKPPSWINARSQWQPAEPSRGAAAVRRRTG